MKRIFKNPIFTFLLGSLLFGSIGVVASQLFASQIEYTPNWTKENGDEITNVEEAIDYLYDKADNTYFNPASSVYSAGIAIPDRNVTKELSKGKYVVSIAFGLSTVWSGATNTSNDVSLMPMCSNESDCIIEKLKAISIHQKSNTNNSYLNMVHSMYYVKVLSDSTVLNYNHHYGETYDTHSTILNMEVSKIN